MRKISDHVGGIRLEYPPGGELAMRGIVIDPDVPGAELRRQLYAGDLVILTRLRALREFADYTREELTELFRPYDPEHVHEHIDPPEMAKILSAWKPRFIHAERST